MILIVHIIFGAAIGSMVNNIPLAIVLAFLSHYFLDFIPHVDYPIKNVQAKQWKKILPDIIRIILDFCLGLALILIFSDNKPIIYICGISAALPDLLSGIDYIWPNKTLGIFYRLNKKVHYFENKKISNFWRISTQVAVVIISILLFKI